ncbi:MAG: GFA family protein [Pseudomonadota bacterium]
MAEAISGVCHCGAVAFVLTAAPEALVRCNCSICRRLGALWGHLNIPAVRLTMAADATRRYIHGDRMLAFHSCATCGCTTHWENLLPDGEHMAVNFNLCEPQEVARHRIRDFDGAETWTFLDEE